MSWFSSLATLTSWITTIFFYLALLIITPWLLALVYDLLLYTWRSLTYNIPLIGGRARGARPPAGQAPTVTERPDGATRTPPVELARQVAVEAEKAVVRGGEEAVGKTRTLRRREGRMGLSGG